MLASYLSRGALVILAVFALQTSVSGQRTQRVSVDSAGAEGNYDSGWSSISADGRYVAFESSSTNLVSGDVNKQPDVFLHDRLTETTECISVDLAGSPGNGASFLSRHSVSADGRFVAFTSWATNLISGNTTAQDAFVRDRQTGTTELVSVDSSGLEANGPTWVTSISTDGRYVVFESDATNLDPNDFNHTSDVFVRDRQASTTERVSLDSSNNEGNAASGSGTISTDGRYVVFESFASNLVPNDTNGVNDIFLRDRQAGIADRVSVDSSGM